MRLWLIPLLVLPLAHCSCQREPAAAASPTGAVDGTAQPATADHAPRSSPDDRDRDRDGQRAAFQAAVSHLHAYLRLAPGMDPAAADAFWAGGHPGQSPDDAIVRARADLQDLRIRNRTPRALDMEMPPRAVEIPVELRLRTQAGEQRIDGWYRLRLGIDGQRWEITSASLQPRLD